MNRNQPTLLQFIAKKAQRVAFAAAARDSAVLEKDCKAVQLVASTDCRIEFNSGGATEGTAAGGTLATNVTTGASPFLKAGVVYLFEVPTAGTATKISVIRDTADGNLDITQLS